MIGMIRKICETCDSRICESYDSRDSQKCESCESHDSQRHANILVRWDFRFAANHMIRRTLPRAPRYWGARVSAPPKWHTNNCGGWRGLGGEGGIISAPRDWGASISASRKCGLGFLPPPAPSSHFNF